MPCTVTANNVMAIIGGNVCINTTSPQYELDVQGHVQANYWHTGDLFFQKDGIPLRRMFEDEEGFYLENLNSGKLYTFVLKEIGNI